MYLGVKESKVRVSQIQDRLKAAIKMRFQGKTSLLLSLMCFLILNLDIYGARAKDAGQIVGLGPTQLTGFGLVMGLRNTGDGPRTSFTTKGIVNMLRNMGLDVPQNEVRVKNVAAVMVTAQLPPFAKKGSKIDITLSSIGDARSLEGGTLVMTPLTAADGKIYALGQGALSIGGFSTGGGNEDAGIRRNHTLVAEIPGGALVQKENQWQIMPEGNLTYTLHQPDFSSLVALVKAVNSALGDTVARAVDAASLELKVPSSYSGEVPRFLADFEQIAFAPDIPNRVVLNEKTGTLVAGGEIAIAPVAVTHGSLTISVSNEETTEQSTDQEPRRQRNTTATTRSNRNVQAEQQKADIKVLPKISSVAELATALNALGVGPRDLIAIFQAIKKAGALDAELVVM